MVRPVVRRDRLEAYPTMRQGVSAVVARTRSIDASFQAWLVVPETHPQYLFPSSLVDSWNIKQYVRRSVLNPRFNPQQRTQTRFRLNDPETI